MTSSPNGTDRVQAVAERFAELPPVIAVVWAGSEIAGTADPRSDFDLYIYTREELPVSARKAIASTFSAGRIEIDNRFWEPGDEWIDATSGRGVDIMYRSPEWIEEQLDRILSDYQASVGYSTCFWYNVLHSHAVVDSEGWYADLQQRARQPYPDQLVRAILAKNHPILRETKSSYRHQIESAIARRDQISVNHRTAALLASVFDCVFAINCLPHPGEKRLLEYSLDHCAHLPAGFSYHVEALLMAAAAPWEANTVLLRIDALLDALDAVLLSSEDSP